MLLRNLWKRCYYLLHKAIKMSNNLQITLKVLKSIFN